MFVGRDFLPVDPGEEQVLGLDFVNDFDAGEFITSVVTGNWIVTVSPDSPATDPNPSAILNGPAGIVGTTVTAQRVSGMLPNVIYTLQAKVLTSGLNTRSLWTHLPGEEVR